jgi:DNA invertase Pin-like site-specific DNA recombinase
MARAVILARVSDPKQKINGDSLEDQLIKCSSFIRSQGWIKDRDFNLVESGRKGERQYFWELYDYCKSKQNTPEKIDYLVCLNIGALYQSGGEDYLKLKRDFEKSGLKLLIFTKQLAKR